MLNRFTADDNRLLFEALRDQVVVQGNEEVARRLGDVARLRVLEIDPTKPELATLVRQDDADNEIFFILTGRVTVLVNGREVAVRGPGVHVGEMAMIDPKARRCASVIAVEPTVVAAVKEAEFTSLANEHPYLWRQIAKELCDRLRQRNDRVKAPNPRPVMFIGCSVESLPIAEEIQLGLQHHDVVAKVWTNHVFGASSYPMEDLEREVLGADFAVLALGKDDKVTSRGTEEDAPRDNVVFELGLFLGQLWRSRTFIVKPRKLALKIPSDLMGLNPLEYQVPTDAGELPIVIGPVCTELKKIVNKLGPR